MMTRPLVALLCLLMISGCASLFEQSPTRPEEEEAAQCEWEITRGIAVFTGQTEGNHHFRFHPGSTEITQPATEMAADASIGDEFKALLRIPIAGPCQSPEIELVEPVGGN